MLWNNRQNVLITTVIANYIIIQFHKLQKILETPQMNTLSNLQYAAQRNLIMIINQTTN